MARVSSVPTACREAFIASDGFEQRLAQAAGLHVFSSPSICSDPLVIRQHWLIAASGNSYPDHAFFHFFAEHDFRVVLRLLLTHDILSREAFLQAALLEDRLTTYLTFLHDQEMVLHTRTGYLKGPYLAPFSDIGHTLEQWIAQWLRMFLAFQGVRLSNPAGRVPVRHGVSITELVGAGDPGDLDVAAVFPQGLVLVECKSSLHQITRDAWEHFAWRVAFLQPAFALFLVDTPASSSSQAFRAARRSLHRWQFTQAVQHEHVCAFQRAGLLQASGPMGQHVSWEAGRLHAALIGREQSLEETLSTLFCTWLSEMGDVS